MDIRIGYQGVEGSYSYLVAADFAKKLDTDSYELVPLKNSRNVANYLNGEKISYGVVAFQNNLAGTVKETYDAFSTQGFEHYDTIIHQINHCLFTGKETQVDQIDQIISHEMALKQCGKYLNEKFPHVSKIAVEDTALAANYLVNNPKYKNTAVICSLEAGQLNNLRLIEKGIQDHIENYTEFRIYKVRNYKEEIPLKYKLLSFLYSDEKPELVVNGFIVITIFLLFFLYNYLYQGNNSFAAASFFGGIISTITVTLSSKKLRRKFAQSYLKGYFIYHTISDSQDISSNQRFQIPRLVKVFEENGNIKMEIFIADRGSLAFAKSVDVLYSDLSHKIGNILYTYETADKNPLNMDFKGIVYMSWRKEKKWNKISKLSARYYGLKTSDTGSVHYHRISKEEFNRVRSLDYLHSSKKG